MGLCCATPPLVAGAIRTRKWPLSRHGGGDGRSAPAPATGRLLIDRPIARTKPEPAVAVSHPFRVSRAREGLGLRRVLSQISGWRDRCLIRWRVAAERRAGFSPEPGRLPISTWRIRLAAAAELWGQRRRRRAGNTAVRGLRRVLSLRFQAGAIAVFIRSRVAAERRAEICPEPWTGRPPISVWRIRLAAAAELWRQRRRRRAGNTAVRGLRRVLSLRFQAGAIAVFIRWRVAAERRAGFCPSLGLGGCRFLFGEFGWRRRPSYGVSVAAGGLATTR